MSYIGNVPTTAAFLTDTFSGNGSTTAFTMSVAPATTSSVLVSITGVLQSPDTYSVSGTTLTFSAAPPSGTNNISARYLGIPASGVTTTAYRTVTNFTATAGQTSFSVPSYTVGYIDVYRNGVRLVSTDYTATTGTTVVLANACTVGDAVVTESFLVSSVLNAIPNSPASVGTSNIVSGVTLTSPTLTGTATATTITAPASTALTLQSNNGTTGLNITAAGQVTTPLQPAFVAVGTAGTSVAQLGVIVFNGTTVNRGSCYSTSTGLFTAPVTGVYSFQTTVLWQGLTNGQQIEGLLGVNGSGGGYSMNRNLYQANYTGYGGYMEMSTAASLYLTANDTVGVYNISGNALTTFGGTSWTRFSGYLVG